MSADLNTEITLRGSKEELAAFLSVLKSYETHKHEQYLELVDLESGTETAALRELDEDGISRFAEAAGYHITVSAFGPWGAFGELGDVRLFERLAKQHRMRRSRARSTDLLPAQMLLLKLC